MNVQSVTSINYKKHNNNRVSNPNFKAELSNRETERILRMLKDKVNGVKICNDIGDLEYISTDLIFKHKDKGVSNAGAMLIPDAYLSSFVGNRIPRHLKSGKKGLCVAVGDKNAPIETWNTVYDAILILFPKSIFK